MSNSRFQFALATEQDDAALRQRMAEDWMRGDLSISFRREPSYFLGCAVQGESVQVIKCTDQAAGRLMGMGSRAARTCYVNGIPARVGYLADLRAHPDARKTTLLARGYRFLRQLHEADPIPLYTTVIFEGNQDALSALTGGRAGLPTYQDYGRILTPAIHLDFAKRALAVPGVEFRPADVTDTPRLIEFLNGQHSRKQFAPVTRRLEGEFLLGFQGDRIVASAAAWEQSAFRQTHIEAYSPPLRRIRPFYNALARVTPLKALPAPGARVPYFYLSSIAVEDDNVALFAALVREVYRRRRSGPWHYFIAGLHERDPLNEVLSSYRQIPAAGRLFVVHYEDGAGAYAALDSRMPYVEVATL